MRVPAGPLQFFVNESGAQQDLDEILVIPMKVAHGHDLFDVRPDAGDLGGTGGQEDGERSQNEENLASEVFSGCSQSSLPNSPWKYIQ